MKKYFYLSILIAIVCIVFPPNVFLVSADNLSETIEEQLNKIDLSSLENFFQGSDFGNSFFSNLENLLSGKYNLNFNSIFEYVIKILFSNIYELTPLFLTIFSISIFCSLVNNVKGSFFSSEIADIIFFVCFLTIILLFSTQVISLFDLTKQLISKIGVLNNVLSPILLTLMVASGGNVSASIYKPAVAFLSGAVINIVLYFILPMVALSIIFSIMSNFSETVKLKKFSDFFSSTIRWIIGIIITVFSLFLTVQGIAGASFDGISIKAAKFAISNSIPLIGGFLKDGFDLVVAGSILIKNSIGVAVVVALFYIIISPVLQIIIFSLMLKLISAIIEPISDSRLSGFCETVSKGISYLLVCILFVAFMFFIMIILMIFSANSFI